MLRFPINLLRRPGGVVEQLQHLRLGQTGKALAAGQRFRGYDFKIITAGGFTDVVSAFQVVHHVVDQFLSDGGFFVFPPHFFDFGQRRFNRLRMTVGNVVDFDEDKAFVGFHRL